jgi:hypothetical protein
VSNSDNSNGAGFAGLITAIFVILKLTGAIDWSWWWVLGPLWLPFAFALIFMLAAAPFWLAGANQSPRAKVDAYKRRLA